ncbi:bromodomain-containing protein 9 [Artemisia annua]|uniref:Bromodomain-containing protein 9 n=1 Tax=Artemisia annua TaxID=35608 RepID=A0A2U1NGK2_ARTAN|nr:bromodomain-containing protein 9 [Artemisia annua]
MSWDPKNNYKSCPPDEAQSFKWPHNCQKLKSENELLVAKDIYELFAEPGDPEEDPIDFGTVRAKLHEGMHTSLEQFEFMYELMACLDEWEHMPLLKIWKEFKMVMETSQILSLDKFPANVKFYNVTGTGLNTPSVW